MHFLFSHDSGFLFWYGHGVARDGFLLEGETGGIHSVIISLFVVLTNGLGFAKLFSGERIRKTEIGFPARRKGSGE